jgi:type I restriction enzyme S subunit
MKLIPITEFAELNPKTFGIHLNSVDLVSFIPMADVDDSGRWRTQQSRPLCEVSSGFTSFQEGDVLFAKITPCMENGKGAHAVDLVNGLGFGSTEFHVIRAKGGNFARFLYHWIQSSELRHAAAAQMIGSAGQQRVPTVFFTRFLVPEINPEKQRRIAEILDSADEAITNAEAVIEKLKMMRIGIMHDLLTRGLAKNGKLRPPPSEAPDLYREHEGEFIPQDWISDKLKTRADVYGGKRLPSGHVYADGQTRWRYLRVVDFYQKPIDFDEIECLTENTFKALSRYEISNGNLFISIAGSLGFAGVLASPSELRVILTENAARIEVGDSLVPKFLAIQINAPRVQRQIHLEMGIGGGVPKLALFRIENLSIVVPSRLEQQMIVERLDSIDTSLRAEVSECQKLRNLKSGLMSDLLRGKISA